MSFPFRGGRRLWIVAVAAGSAAGGLWAADPPAPPMVSSFAPADDLIAQVEYFVGRGEEALAAKAEYDEAKQSRIKKDANTLAVLALALGMHDTDHKLKSAAPAVLKAAQDLAGKAADFDSAKAAHDALKKSLTEASSGGGELKWDKVASLEMLMKQVPLIHNGLKRSVDERRFKQQLKLSAGQSAALAAISQGVMADTHEVKNPADLDKWFQSCVEFRESAAAVNAAIHAEDLPATKAAMTRLSKSCDACHKVFRKEKP